MSTPAPAESLLAEFPEHNYALWHQAAEQLLKGASFEKLLVSKTYEDITIQPIYLSEDIAQLEQRKQMPGSGSHVRGSRPGGFLMAGWEVSQELITRCPVKFNQIALEGLRSGQSELNIPLSGPGHPSALVLKDLGALQTALDGIDLGAISSFWRAGSHTLPAAALYFAAARQSRLDFKTLRGCFENDPLGELALNGTLDVALATRLDHLAALTRFACENAPQIQTLSVQGAVYHNGGGSATQELGYTLATLVSYIEELKERGIAPATAFQHVRLCFSVGSDYFMEIAKLRAARWLLCKVAGAYGVEHPNIHIHASTSRWNKTTYDAHTNMLRVTAEAFAAVVAGVDSLHIGPYDEPAGSSDAFSRRIARNIHIILREECGLDRVIDPGGGSNYIEWLSDQVAAKSWSLFQEVEQHGGMLACLEDGSIQKSVAAVCHAKLQNIRRRKDKVVGCNMYPDLKGKKLASPTSRTPHNLSDPVSDCDTRGDFHPQFDSSADFHSSALVTAAIAAATIGATTAEIAAGSRPDSSAPSLTIEPIPQRRAAEEFEALRDAAAGFADKSGAPPTILQLNIGPSGRYRLRADWTASFFEAAGFVIDGSRDFKTHADAIEAAAASKAGIAVITSDDATYLESVVPLATAIKAARPALTLLVAGTPGDLDAAWRAAGVDHFVNVRSNNYELNQQLLKGAGVL